MRAFLFMKYTLKFITEVKDTCKRHMHFYNDELKELLDRHGYINMFEEKFAPLYNNRWNANEIFAVMEDRSSIRKRLHENL